MACTTTGAAAGKDLDPSRCGKRHYGTGNPQQTFACTLYKQPPSVVCQQLAQTCFSYGTNFLLPENADMVNMSHPAMLPTMNIGETIRNYRLQKGMSQGDIEKRTGLLRCYLSRVENGHTIPSLDTLSKIAGAMELPLSQFFSESGHTNGSKGLPQLSDDEVRFLSQIRRYATNLNDSDRKLVLAMVKKMASNSGK